jgi:NAD(P)-dependent dehydrogenase (short-subunit alcohol dehydrogenase family)
MGAQGAEIILLCRSAEKGAALVAELKASGAQAQVVLMDMTSLASVAAAAKRVAELAPKLDILINNAGVVDTSRRETKDGFEEMFGVNHLAHFLLTMRLVPNLKAAGSARIVHVSSMAHKFIGAFDFDDYNWKTRRFRSFPAYGQSKLANLLFNRKLARLLAGSGVTSNALHPGAVSTSLGTQNGGLMSKIVPLLLKPFFLTPEGGARTSIYLASDPSAAQYNGEYFDKCRAIAPKANALDDAAAERLWALSEQLLAEHNMAAA